RLSALTERFLKRRLSCIGFIPEDVAVKESVAAQRLLSTIQPQSAAGAAIGNLAAVLRDRLGLQSVGTRVTPSVEINGNPALADIRK
ncbi:MAG: hypothetical protein AB1744_03400, partial [Candidatus Zixiibacteriota bacterium]